MLMMHHGGEGQPIHTWPPKDIQAHIQFMLDLNKKLTASGELVDAQGLAWRGRRARPGARAEPVLGSCEAGRDDALELYFTCCHPALTPPSAIALTLRAVGGLTTAEIARAFLVPEATMAQRISRAKQGIQASGVPLRVPAGAERAQRLRDVQHVLYLTFSEGYASGAGPELQRVELAREAIRLAHALHDLVPEGGESAGLLALMLLTDARRRARTGPLGELVPLDEQDHRLESVRAHLHEFAGDARAAIESRRLAASRTASLPERNHLTTRAARLANG
jgi:predicted RNA polymerase sigma factor